MRGRAPRVLKNARGYWGQAENSLVRGRTLEKRQREPGVMKNVRRNGWQCSGLLDRVTGDWNRRYLRGSCGRGATNKAPRVRPTKIVWAARNPTEAAPTKLMHAGLDPTERENGLKHARWARWESVMTLGKARREQTRSNSVLLSITRVQRHQGSGPHDH